MKRIQTMLMVSVAVVVLVGCGNDLTGNDGDTDGNGDGTDGNGDGTGGNGDGTGGNSDFPVCGEVTGDLTQISSRLMLLEDKSKSMEDDNKWALAVDAIDGMVTTFDTSISFGLDLFALDGNDRCAVGNEATLDVALNNGSTILGTLDATGPENATPLYLAMSNYLDSDYAPVFLDGNGQSYLVIISDGMDTCGANGEFDMDDGATAEQLGSIAASLLADHGIHSIVIGFGDGADGDQLNAIYT